MYQNAESQLQTRIAILESQLDVKETKIGHLEMGLRGLREEIERLQKLIKSLQDHPVDPYYHSKGEVE